MKTKLVAEGLVLVSENKEEDEKLLKAFKRDKRVSKNINAAKRCSIPLYCKASHINKRGRRELLLQEGEFGIGWNKVFKGKTRYER